MWQQDSSLPPAVVLVTADRPQQLPLLLRLPPLLDVQRAHVLARHVVPEGHAQVGVRRHDGQAGQTRRLLVLLVLALPRLAGQLHLRQLHVDEVAWSACRGQQHTR